VKDATVLSLETYTTTLQRISINKLNKITTGSKTPLRKNLTLPYNLVTQWQCNLALENNCAGGYFITTALST